jgi:hypothetical protein
MKKKFVQIGVAGRNASGAPDVVFVDVNCTKSQIQSGEHYDLATAEAEKIGYEPKMAFDSSDPAWRWLNFGNAKRDLALTSLLAGLKVLGFGTEQSIDGADAVEAIAVLYADVTDRILVGCEPSAENPKATRAYDAQRFMQELLDSVDTLSGIAESHGVRTLADLMYLQNAILSGGFIDHYPDESKVLDIASALPSGREWSKYILKNDQPREATAVEGIPTASAGSKDYYLIAMQGDVDPSLLGPFDDDSQRLQAAREYRQNESDDDGLYRLDVPKGVVPVVDIFSGGELGVEADPVVTYILERLAVGDEVIERFLIAGALYFTVQYQGDDWVITAELLHEIETALSVPLVRVERVTVEVLIPRPKAAKEYSKEDWQSEVASGDTKLGYHDWVEHNVDSLPLASSVL